MLTDHNQQQLRAIKPEMPFYSGLKDIAIGFVFVMISFRLNNFDVFVDFIGYLIIKIGINRLKPFSINFSKAGKANSVLLFLSLFKIVIVKVKISSLLTIHAPIFMANAKPHYGYGYILFFIILFGLIQFIFEWRFYMHFFRGLIDISYLVNASHLGLKASSMWIWIRIWLVSSVLIIAIVLFPKISVLMVLLFLGFYLMLLIGLLRLCYKFGHLVVNKPVQNEQPD